MATFQLASSSQPDSLQALFAEFVLIRRLPALMQSGERPLLHWTNVVTCDK
jgi:hypothetical protein